MSKITDFSEKMLAYQYEVISQPQTIHVPAHQHCTSIQLKIIAFLPASAFRLASVSPKQTMQIVVTLLQLDQSLVAGVGEGDGR